MNEPRIYTKAEARAKEIVQRAVDAADPRIAELESRLAEAERLAEDWKRARQESEDTIRDIVALVPRDPRKEDIFAAIRRVMRERAEAERVADAHRGHKVFVNKAYGGEMLGCETCLEREDYWGKQKKALADARGELEKFRKLASIEDTTWDDAQWRAAIKGILAGVQRGEPRTEDA